MKKDKAAGKTDRQTDRQTESLLTDSRSIPKKSKTNGADKLSSAQHPYSALDHAFLMGEVDARSLKNSE